MEGEMLQVKDLNPSPAKVSAGYDFNFHKFCVSFRNTARIEEESFWTGNESV